MAMLNQVPSPLTRYRIERAMYRDRYDIETSSYTQHGPAQPPIRARDQKCLPGGSARREIDCSACVPTVGSKSYGRVYTLIYLVSSSSIDDTVRVFNETDTLSSSFFSLEPLPSLLSKHGHVAAS